MISIASRKVSASKIERRLVLGTVSAVAVVALFAFAAASAQAEDGAALWAKNCAACHGKDGKKSNEKTGLQDLTSAAVKAKLTRAAVLDSMNKGVKAKEGDKMAMKSYADKLSKEQIEALADYTMALK